MLKYFLSSALSSAFNVLKGTGVATQPPATHSPSRSLGAGGGNSVPSRFFRRLRREGLPLDPLHTDRILCSLQFVNALNWDAFVPRSPRPKIQDDPTWLWDGAMGQHGPNIGLRWPNMHSWWPQNAPTFAQDDASMGQDGPSWDQDGATWGKHGPTSPQADLALDVSTECRAFVSHMSV